MHELTFQLLDSSSEYEKRERERERERERSIIASRETWIGGWNITSDKRREKE
jgi:hypothetical protein